jgi:hypothetical protein
VLAELFAQHRLVEGVARRQRTGMGVRADQPRQQPPLGHQLRTPDGIGRPPVTVGVEIDVLAPRQGVATDP